MPALLTSKDFWSGVMLIAVGVAAAIIARGIPFGTALRMGPGYFPTILGGILVLFGLWLVAKSLRHSEPIEGGWSLRALIVLPLSLVLFGILMDRAGFIPALAVLIFGSAAASTEFKLTEVATLTVFLIVFCVAVFVWGLGLPYPLLLGY
jgi:Tripartite tricarboxylate transporter TctB family